MLALDSFNTHYWRTEVGNAYFPRHLCFFFFSMCINLKILHRFINLTKFPCIDFTLEFMTELSWNSTNYSTKFALTLLKVCEDQRSKNNEIKSWLLEFARQHKKFGALEKKIKRNSSD